MVRPDARFAVGMLYSDPMTRTGKISGENTIRLMEAVERTANPMR